MTPKHTPAPWRVGGGLNIENEFGYRIAFVSNCEQSLFNAELIAAAPELLDALVDALQYIEDYVPSEIPFSIQTKMKTAIARATA